MKPHSDLNTELRKKATKESVRDQCKLANNSVFGKTLENPLKRVRFKFVTDRETAVKFWSKLDFIESVEFTPHFHALHMRQSKIKWDKPTPVGAAILALSKICMYRFFYFCIKPKWGKKSVLYILIQIHSFWKSKQKTLPKTSRKSYTNGSTRRSS